MTTQQPGTPGTTEILNAFCSLGDNCEFGFVQRKFNLEPGDLLRWAIASPEAVTKGLKRKFDDLYSYERLVPSQDNMVVDTLYGICFHTELRSEVTGGQRSFKATDADRRIIHREEVRKIQYLTSKLLVQLERAEKIFVFKRNTELTAGEAAALCEQLLAYNPRNALLLTGTSDRPPGTIWRAGPGLIRGSIDRLAPYEKADDASFAVWLELCRKAHASHLTG